MKTNQKETFLTLDGGCDKKNRLLRSTARLTMEQVETIDSGNLSLEDLEAMVRSKAQLFKYQTQITIHADFPREVGSRVNGYAFLINNKNGSVGIRYGAIDEAKRKQLHRFLCYEGFKYDKNSTEHVFRLGKRFGNRAEANEYLDEIRARYDYQALRALIYGRIAVIGFECWGLYYVVLEITVNAIPQVNIPQFLTLMRCKSEIEITAIEQQERIKRLDEQKNRDEERRLRQAREDIETAQRRTQMLETLSMAHRRVTQWPAGDCSLCVVTDAATLVVVKQFTLKNGKQVMRKFLQVGNNLRDYKKWNTIIPPHTALDTSVLSDNALRRYIADGTVFSLETITQV